MQAPPYFPADAAHHSAKNDKGEFHVWITKDNIVFTQLQGFFSRDLMMAPFVTPVTARLGGGKKISIFHDWAGMEDYEPFVRQHLTAWIAQYKAQVKDHLILVRSKVVALGVSTAGRILKLNGTPLSSTSNRIEFGAKLRLAVTGAAEPIISARAG